MTNVTPNPRARCERLFTRAKEAHEMVSRLMDDLRDEEGWNEAASAQDSLSSLCHVLEERVNAQ